MEPGGCFLSKNIAQNELTSKSFCFEMVVLRKPKQILLLARAGFVLDFQDKATRTKTVSGFQRDCEWKNRGPTWQCTGRRLGRLLDSTNRRKGYFDEDGRV